MTDKTEKFVRNIAHVGYRSASDYHELMAIAASVPQSHGHVHPV